MIVYYVVDQNFKYVSGPYATSKECEFYIECMDFSGWTGVKPDPLLIVKSEIEVEVLS